MRPETLVEVVDRMRAGWTAEMGWGFHLREFLDTFYLADGDAAAQAAMISDDPGLLDDPKLDAYVGATGEHLARRWGHESPQWTFDPRRYLAEPLFEVTTAALRRYLEAASPVAFRTRNIFVGPEPLMRARFPYKHGEVVELGGEPQPCLFLVDGHWRYQQPPTPEVLAMLFDDPTVSAPAP